MAIDLDGLGLVGLLIAAASDWRLVHLRWGHSTAHEQSLHTHTHMHNMYVSIVNILSHP
jgi:hypothetical protein